jgi:hypothetical protein
MRAGRTSGQEQQHALQDDVAEVPAHPRFGDPGVDVSRLEELCEVIREPSIQHGERVRTLVIRPSIGSSPSKSTPNTRKSLSTLGKLRKPAPYGERC